MSGLDASADQGFEGSEVLCQSDRYDEGSQFLSLRLPQQVKAGCHCGIEADGASLSCNGHGQGHLTMKLAFVWVCRPSREATVASFSAGIGVSTGFHSPPVI